MFRCAALSTSFSGAGADLFRAAGLSARDMVKSHIVASR